VSFRSKHRPQAAPAAATDPIQVPIKVPWGAHPDHHLWRNGRLWWVAFTVHRGHQQERVRLSLGTDDLLVARARRDKLLSLYAKAAELRVSLRFSPRCRQGKAAGWIERPVGRRHALTRTTREQNR
jgi:hypothetical protein